MMPDQIAEAVKESLCVSITLVPAGEGRVLLDTPFLFPDGDGLPIILEHHGDGWVFSDDGETFMHLAVLLPNFDSDARMKLIEESLAAHGVENRRGALVRPLQGDDYAGYFASFVQALTEVMHTRIMTRDSVRETFREDARALLTRVDPTVRFDYNHAQHDPRGLYRLDAVLGDANPTGVMLVANDDQCRNATIVLQRWEIWNEPLESVVIFKDVEQLTRRPREQLGDVAGKTYSSLAVAAERLPVRLGRIAS